MEYTILLIVEVLSALGLIGLVLLQQGKGAEAGASFGGGASQTIFGSSGSGNFMTRMTAIFATIFFLASLGLAYVSGKAGQGDGLDFSKVAAPQEVPVSELPVINSLPSSDLPVLPSVNGDGDGDASEVELPGASVGASPEIEMSEAPRSGLGDGVQEEGAASVEEGVQESSVPVVLDPQAVVSPGSADSESSQ